MESLSEYYWNDISTRRYAGHCRMTSLSLNDTSKRLHATGYQKHRNNKAIHNRQSEVRSFLKVAAENKRSKTTDPKKAGE